MKILALKTLCWIIALVGFFVIVPVMLVWDYLDHAVTDLLNEGLS